MRNFNYQQCESILFNYYIIAEDIYYFTIIGRKYQRNNLHMAYNNDYKQAFPSALGQTQISILWKGFLKEEEV